MKRIIFAVSVLAYFGISYSARGEDHSGGATGGRTVIQVPAISKSDRLGELIDACSLKRPFPNLRMKQIEVATPGQPPGELAPTLPPSTTTPPTGGSVDAGKLVFDNRCAKCHSGGSAPDIKGNVDGTTARTAPGAAKPMPADGPALTEQERSDLIAFMQSSR